MPLTNNAAASNSIVETLLGNILLIEMEMFFTNKSGGVIEHDVFINVTWIQANKQPFLEEFLAHLIGKMNAVVSSTIIVL